MERKTLNDNEPAAGGDELARLFDSTESAPDIGEPVPAGTYACVVASGRRDKNHNGTNRYAVCFSVADGPHVGYKLFRDFYLTPDAMAYSKRELGTLGITSGDQLSRPLPAGRICCDVIVTVWTLNDGRRRNEVKSFVVTNVLSEQPNPFPLDVEGGSQ